MHYDHEAELRRVEKMADLSQMACVLGTIGLLLVAAAGVFLFMAERSGG